MPAAADAGDKDGLDDDIGPADGAVGAETEAPQPDNSTRVVSITIHPLAVFKVLLPTAWSSLRVAPKRYGLQSPRDNATLPVVALLRARDSDGNVKDFSGAALRPLSDSGTALKSNTSKTSLVATSQTTR